MVGKICPPSYMFSTMFDWIYDCCVGLRRRKKTSLNDALYIDEDLTEEEIAKLVIDINVVKQ